MTVFRGLSAFPITPTDAAGRVDTDALCRLLDRIAAAGADSVGLLGSTGTYMYLDRAERRRALDAAAVSLKGATPLIASVGALRTDEAVALAQDAAAAGADALLLAPVSYTPLTDDEVCAHFVTVAEATDLPLCIYNNPGTTHFSFGADLLERLSRHPQIAAVKMPLPPNGDLAADLQRLRACVPDEFRIGYSGDWGCAAALQAGADMWFSVIGGILPEPAVALTRAAIARDQAEVDRVEATLQPLWKLFQDHGSLRVVYAMAAQLSLTQAVPPRPILPLPQAEQVRVAEAMAAACKS